MSLNLTNPIAGEGGYTTTLPAGTHWSLVIRRGMGLTLTDLEGGANVGLLMYNPTQLSEKYNAPDSLKCQHTFKLTRSHCLYSDMGRIFCSIIKDSFGWHDTVCGNSHASHIEACWGNRDYQNDRNEWQQNGYDSFLVELAKYELTRRHMAANVNFFSEISTDDEGNLQLSRQAQAGDRVTLRFEMDTLVVLHTCPHPLNHADQYPRSPVQITLAPTAPLQADDECLNLCDENRRGFANNALYHLGQ
ncbi:urea carboxylase-associated family protein [Pseudomaricurvus alkylphenolicus]|uniref:urea amidolyase associated protein UAAP1 n=1 Tax=Pseudomaricurvus alkylphenolicus TaxID=1306991 RepID=UPI00141F0335|nr:urea amidolyase associated protein UAAP1 [Pseudomaricurvus alkylphenolicus]NIB40688.1 urea carboxylase-associated family protein [Pseudomaricurvus alkylphenolicus]